MRKFLIVLLSAAAVAVFVQSLPDLKRYLKIRQM
ncbi:DUF6893 family small protein [Streptomyces sp. NRRL B-24484]